MKILIRSTSSRVAVSCALAGALVLMGCGGGDGPAGGPDGGAPADATAGTGAPTATVSPGDGARGVLATDPIVVTFSEPMDPASVEAAWSSASLPAAQMVFAWNDAATVLTVDASAVLTYPVGGRDVDVLSYELAIDATAVDAEGDALAVALTSSFHTARDVTMPLGRVSATTGGFDGNGVTVDVRAGDAAGNVTWRGFITIDLDELPAVVELTSATLAARQTTVVGTPYAQLGDLQLVHLEPIEIIDQAAYTGVARSAVGVFSASARIGEEGQRSLDATAAVAADVAAGHAASTFRLEFDSGHDGEGDEDHVIFDPTSVAFEVRLLAE